MKRILLSLCLTAYGSLLTGVSLATCPQVNAAFTTSQTNICGPGPQVISFVNTSTGANNLTADYEWFLNGVPFDNTTGMGAPGTSLISAVGTYTYMLVATDVSVPCTDTATVTVIIHPLPNAGFTFGPDNNCGELPVNFVNTSTGTTGTTTYAWNFGDGGTATTTNATHSYATGGSFNVTLTQTNAAGCTDTETQTVNVLPVPATGISGADADGDLTNCLLPADPSTSEIVTFSNTTTGGVSYTWDFGDGSGTFTTASLADFDHTYTSYGTYTVTMTATHANGCTSTDTLTVVFEKYVSAAMTLDITEYSGCAPHELNTLTNLSVNANSYTWNFGDGTIITTTSSTPPSHFYTVAGTYTISLTAVNSCNTANSTISPIVIVAGPNSGFNNSLGVFGNLGCAPQNVTFANTSAGTSPANNYQWNMGNGNTYTNVVNPPAQTYSTTGVYTVTLIAGNACGYDTITTTLTIDTIPVVDIVSTPLDGCSPLVVSTTNNSYAPPINYTWTVDGVFAGNAATLPNQTFINSGGNNPVNHTIQLVGSNHCGNDSDAETITVHPETIANFVISTDTICEGQSVLFTSTSTGENLTYAWDFGVSTETTAGPHNIQFNTAGTYSVELTVDGFCGPDVIVQDIVVLPIPVADFTANPVDLCAGEAVSLTNNSTLGGTYAWTFTNGTPATSNVYSPAPVTFSTAGTQTISLTVNVLGCTATDTETITVNPIPDANFTLTPNNGCTPLDVTPAYTGIPLIGDTYDWDLGNGNTSVLPNPPVQTYIANTADSIYTVTLVVTSAAGCINTNSLTITVHPLPVADYTALPDTACAGTPIGFLNNSTGASTYAWTFGDGATSSAVSPSHIYTQTGDITTQLVATTAFGCTDTLQVPVYIDSIPTANFSFDIVCEIDTTHFTDLSTGGVTDWSWNFGDGSPLDLTASPAHFYGNDGTYSVSLTVTNPANCTNTLTQLVNVSTVPVANFSTGSTCLGSVSSFTDLSTGITSSWEWNFGDGSPVDNNQNPTHTYGATGTYNVQLIAMAGNGCSDTITLPITVTPIPTADFSFIDVCTNDETFFTDLSAGAPDTWSWNFGDGSPLSAVQNPVHTYTSAGTFNVTLTAGYAASGCTHSVTQTVTAFPRTTPGFTTNTPCLGGPTIFTDMTGGTPNLWTWDFGDGSPADNTQNPVHTYTSPGIFPIQLVTENAFGCVDTLNASVEVYPLPVADFSSNVVCLNTLTAFTDLSVSAVGWQWDFGDGTPAGVGPNPFHLYSTAGNFDVELVVTNNVGCTDTMVQSITVNPNPTADFTATTACHTYPNFFTDNSTGAVLWTWDFGDASPADNTASPSHVYANPGTYAVNLLVENVFGCTHSITQNVDVLIQPQADFSYNNVCAGEAVQMTDLSTNAPTTFEWDFGDGSPVDFNQNPTHIFDPGGTYNVTLIVGNPAGCTDTLIQPVNVYTVPVPDFSADTVCLFDITTFTDLTVDAAPLASWYYDFTDGNQSFSQNPTYIFQNPGVYNVSLLVTNIYGCDSSVTHPVYVSDIPTADFTADTVCTGNPTTFTDLSTGSPTSWFWNFGDGNTSNTGPVTTHTYALPGTYAVTLFVTGGGGACFDQTFDFVMVSDNLQAGITAPDTVCDGTIVNFTDNSTVTSGTIDTYFWDFGDGSTANTANASHLYAAAGTYTVTHTVSTPGGCTSTTTADVTITAMPEPFFSEVSACQNGTTLFNDLSTISNGTIVSWSWNFGDGSPVSTLQNPTHTYTTSGSFNVTLTVTSDFGCIASYTGPLAVYPAPVADFTAPLACPKDTILYTDLSTISSGTITNWSWNFGDGTTSSVQNPLHAFAILTDSFNVELIVTSDLGCTDTVVEIVMTHPIPDFAWGPDVAAGCQPLIVNFSDSTTVENGVITNWEWSFGDSINSFAQNPTHIYAEPGEYYLSLWVTTSQGCDFYSYVDYPIIVYPKPTAEFTPYFTEVSILEPEVQFLDQSTGALDWEWSFGDNTYSNDPNPLHEFNDTGYFEITQIVYSNFGCADTAVHSVHVYGEFSFFIPNSFTPNGDSKNNTWRGYAWGVVSYELLVFNRWGEVVFSSTDQTVEWDGTYNGIKVPDDVYIWKCFMLDSEQQEHEYYGHVTVLR